MKSNFNSETPTPGNWKASLDNPKNNKIAVWSELNRGRILICTLDNTMYEAKANAEFIAKACNSHYELIDALERCKNYLHLKFPKEADIFNQIELAIEKAK